MSQPTRTDVIAVRLFAALRDAAGESEVLLDAGTSIAALRRDLAARFGRKFAERMEVAAVMVDGRPADPEDETPLQAGVEVALLPPYAGGSAGTRRR